MLEQEYYRQIAEVLPFLKRTESEIAREFRQAAYFARIPAGKDIFIEGDAVQGIALILSGNVRVYKIGENGRELTLYRFGLGESCILTANAILSGQTFPAIATVEKEAEAVIIPSDAFQVWVQRFEPWRGFVFELLSHRLSSVMEIVEEVAFRRMDSRVSALLIDYGQKGNPVRMTHQEIARELGSSREVISRLMEDLSARGLVKVSRGEVEILDFEGLIEVAGK